jgi:HPr kinase/phosphorylase
VDVTDGVVSCPAALAGLLEVRGVGIVRLPHQRARLAMIADLSTTPDRLPTPYRDPVWGVPVIAFDPWGVSAPEKLAMALDCATGRVTQVAGAFVA